jgi:diguanylate cyclase (GGDEF)-like protein
MLAIFVLDFAFLFEITASSFDTAFQSTRAQYFGGPFTAPLYLLFVLDYCNIKWKLYQAASLFIIPIAALVLVFTWPYNGLFYKDIVFVTDAVIPHLKVTGSLFYYISYCYVLLISLASMAVILYYFFKRDAVFKKQSIVLILATFIPAVGIAINAFGSFEIDIAPMLSGVTCILFGYNFLRLDFYRITPVARYQIVENMSDGFVLLDINECFIEANAKAKSIFPQFKSASPGIKIHDIAGINWPKMNGDSINNEFITVLQDNVPKYYQLSQTSIMKRMKVIARSVMIYDATETKKLLDDASALAERDTLTGISNRRALYKKWETLYSNIDEHNRLCLLLLDVDLFKRVNDLYGHIKGDEVLKTIAEQLTSQFRKSDTVARYGGEEFCVLLTDIEMKAAINLARSLKETIANHTYLSNSGEFHVTISIGLVSFNSNHHATIDNMIADADSALYAAKRSGRNTIFSARRSIDNESANPGDVVLECVLHAYPEDVSEKQ